MPRRLRPALLSLALLAASLLAAPTSAAPGIALAWDHCLSEGTGTQNKMFACNTNVGTHVMVGTFELTRNMADVIGAEIILELASASPALPAWWEFKNAGSCRLNSMFVDANANPADLSCPDWSNAQMFLGFAAYCRTAAQCIDHPSSANQVRIKLIEAVAQQFAQDLAGAQPYFAFNLVINNQLTVGAGACGGCDIPVCIVLNSINVVAAGNVENRFISNPSAPGGNFVSWQGGGPGCPAATPTRSTTWGSVKSLYR